MLLASRRPHPTSSRSRSAVRNARPARATAPHRSVFRLPCQAVDAPGERLGQPGGGSRPGGRHPYVIDSQGGLTVLANTATNTDTEDRAVGRQAAAQTAEGSDQRESARARRRCASHARPDAGDGARRGPDDAATGSPAAAVVEREWAALVRCARRYTLTTQDAEDAVQTAWLIAARRPDIPAAGARPWLQTVVRHEAYRTRRLAAGTLAPDALEAGASMDRAPAALHAPATDLDALIDVRAALGACKADERRALLARAGGWSYATIGARLGWSYTKVDRCLKEGRARMRALTIA